MTNAHENISLEVDWRRWLDSFETAHVAIISPTGRKIYFKKHKINKTFLISSNRRRLWKKILASQHQTDMRIINRIVVKKWEMATLKELSENQ